MFRCSECLHSIGLMSDGKGGTTSFICHRTGRVAESIPNYIVPRTTPPLPKWLRPEDLSQRAKKEKKTADLKPLDWSF